MAVERTHRATRAAIYCRVASPGPMTRELLDAQRQCLERYAAKHNIEIVGTYEDIGYPGNTLDRTGMKALMREAAHKTFVRFWLSAETACFVPPARPQFPRCYGAPFQNSGHQRTCPSKITHGHNLKGPIYM